MPHGGHYGFLSAAADLTAPGMTLAQLSELFAPSITQSVKGYFQKYFRPGWAEEAERVRAWGQEQVRFLQGFVSAVGGEAQALTYRAYTLAFDRLAELGRWVQAVAHAGALPERAEWDWDTDLPNYQRLNNRFMTDVIAAIRDLRDITRTDRGTTLTPKPTAADQSTMEWIVDEAGNLVQSTVGQAASGTAGSALLYGGIALAAYGAYAGRPTTLVGGLALAVFGGAAAKE